MGKLMTIQSLYNDILFYVSGNGDAVEFSDWVASMSFEKLKRISHLTESEIQRVVKRLLPRW